MKKLLLITFLILPFLAKAEWRLPNGEIVNWVNIISPVDWASCNAEDNSSYDLVQYGAYVDGQCQNVITPGADNENEFFAYYPLQNVLLQIGSLEGALVSINTYPSADGLTLNFRGRNINGREESNYTGWIKMCYMGTSSVAKDVYFFTVDNRGTYRVLRWGSLEE